MSTNRRTFLKSFATTAVLLAAGCSPAGPSGTTAPASGSGQPAAPKPTDASKPAAPAAAPAAAASPAAATGAAASKPETGPQALAALQTKANKPYTIGLSVQWLTDPFFVSLAYGAEEQSKKAGVKLILHEAGGYQYVDKQIAQIEDLIDRKVDVLITMPTDTNGVKPIVERAAAAGIKVMTQGSTIPTDRLFTHVRADDNELGAIQGEYMGKALNGKGNVIMLNGPAGLFWAIERAEGFKKVLAEKYPELKVAGEYWLNTGRVDGLKQTQDSLQALPQIDGIYSGGDLMAQGASDAVKAAGRKAVITSATLSKDTLDMIVAGLIDLDAAQQPVLMAATSIDTAVRHLNGEQVPRQVYIKAIPVTKENAASLDRTTIHAPDGYKPSLTT